ncbi:MAG: DNA primase [Peptococcaceae bacterium]|nr:DNA primase [Peptococcaceae bacterium]
MNGRISEDVIEGLRQRADIVEIIGEHVVLKKKGQNYTGLCPFHQEKTPSFVVSPGKQIYHCFGCGKGGNVFSFLMEREGISFFEAVEKLAARYGVALPEKEQTPAQKRQEARVKRLRQINRWAFEYYRDCLMGPQGKEGRAYFERRQLTPEILETFGLGYAPDQWDSLTRALLDRQVTEEELLTLGLSVKSQRDSLIDKFRHRVIYPIFDDRSHVVGFGGRTMGDEQPKYLNSQDTPLFSKGRLLYGLNLAKGSIRQKDQVIIMEGYMDVIAAHQRGITNAVASLGTALTQDQARLLTRYTYRTLICYDSDAAGEAATMRGLDILDVQGCQVGIIRVPQGKDPDEFLKNQGPEAFLSLADKAFSLFAYKFSKNMEKFDSDTMAGKVEIIQATLPDLARIKSPVARQGHITMMADTLRFPEGAIKEELRRYTLGAKGRPKTPGRGTPEDGEASGPQGQEDAYGRRFRRNGVQGVEQAQIILFRAMLQKPERLEKIEAQGGGELFQSGPPRNLYLTVQALRQAGYQALKEEELLALVQDPDERDWLTAVLLTEAVPGDEEKKYSDSLFVLKKKRLDDQIKAQMDLLARLEKSGDISGAREVMSRLSGLTIEKQRLKP